MFTENSWAWSTFGSGPGAPAAIWIGFNDLNIEGQFEWVSGDPVIFTNWAASQPASLSGNHDGVWMQGPSGQWFDFDTSSTHPSLIQVASPDWLVERVLQYGEDAEVVGPALYREAVRRAVS